MSHHYKSRSGIAIVVGLVAAGGAFAQAALPEVRVTDDAPETASGPAKRFVAKRSATGTKTDTSLLETPQAISVVTREEMDAQAADSLDQAFGYTAGIMSLAGGAQRRISTGFTVRGFNVTGSAPLYVNGSKFPINSLSGSMEPYSYERVELLKGPASILYGQAAPGGIINLVSKRPTVEPLREIELQLGSWDRKQIAFDFAGPLAQDGSVSYRLNGLQRDAKSMVARIPDDRTVLNAALDWKLGRDTTVTLLATYNKGKSLYDYGKPFDGTLLPNPNGRLSRTLFVGEPGFDKFNTEGTTLGYLFEHRLNENWTFRQNLLAFDYEADNAYAAIQSRANAATGLRTVNRSATSRFDTDKGWALDNQLIGTFATGPVRHTLLAGLDWSDRDFSRAQASGTMGALDLYAPVYGARITLAAPTNAYTSAKQLGLYVQDQLKFGENWIAMLGARYDDAKNGSRSVTAAGAASGVMQKSHAFTPRAGLMYLFANGVAPYYSYTRSFQPTSGMDFFLRPFEPTEGKQHEIGVKYEPPGTNASVTFAAYQLTQRNVLTSDPAHPGSQIQTGEIQSKGFELEGKASIGRWDLSGSLGTTDARITRSNTATLGTRPSSVPRNQAALWVDHRFATVQGLSAGVGVRRVGVQEIVPFSVPSYTVFDAAIRYQIDKWRFALNIKNLADKNYLATCSYACFYGDERNLTLSARYTW
jgi:iron complex outermembrane receptor protein